MYTAVYYTVSAHCCRALVSYHTCTYVHFEASKYCCEIEGSDRSIWPISVTRFQELVRVFSRRRTKHEDRRHAMALARFLSVHPHSTARPFSSFASKLQRVQRGVHSRTTRLALPTVGFRAQKVRTGCGKLKPQVVLMCFQCSCIPPHQRSS